MKGRATSAAYLRPFVRALISNNEAPLAIRDECKWLVEAINANHLELITESLTRLHVIAEREGFELPRIDAKMS